MFFACHLFVGLLAGLVVTETWGKRSLVPFLVVGSVLPDLMDKPLGHILLQDSFDNGRILFHGLLVVALMLMAALPRRYRAPMLCLGGMVLVHQLMDGMWAIPETWFFPLMGAWPQGDAPDYFLMGLRAELTNPTEWAFGVLGLAILVRIYRKVPPMKSSTVAVPSALLLALGVQSLFSPALDSVDAVMAAVGALSAATLWLLGTGKLLNLGQHRARY